MKGFFYFIWYVTKSVFKAEGCLDEFNLELAMKFCERALQTDENNIRALQLTAGLFLDLGEVRAALKDIYDRSTKSVALCSIQ